ncbi:multidrug effflux MFS transporter [Thiotrichales bacterium 19X7-9]|nr:multidrug effflux MFS transporter [Thiotrichales bacterium 19X7-9]
MSKKALYLFICLLAPFVGLGIDISAPSLPAITSYFNTDMNLVKLTIPFYLISYGILQLIFGPLSDSYGRKSILVIGLLIYIIATVLILFSDNIYWLLCLRLLQGVGAASVSVNIRAIIVDSLTAKDLYKAFATFNIAWGVSPIIAPYIGGQLQYYFNWQANFILLLVYACITLVLVVLLLKDTAAQAKAFNLAVTFKNYAHILTSKVFLIGGITSFLGYSCIIYFNVAGPFFVQDTLGYSSKVYGYIALLIGLAFLIGSISNRYLLHKHSLMRLTHFGIILAIIASIFLLLAAFILPESLWLFSLPIFVIILSLGFVQPNLMAYCMQQFPQMAGVASAVIGFMLIAGTGFVNTLTSLQLGHSLLIIAITYFVILIIDFILIMLLRYRYGFR